MKKLRYKNFISFLISNLLIFLILSLLIVPFAYSDTASWISYIESGYPFIVIFDKTKGKFDDSHYSGNWRTDPLGTLEGGKTYKVIYKNGSFYCTGYNQGYKRVGTWSYSNADVRDSLISLWGHIFVFDGKGRVYDKKYGLVGHMEKTNYIPIPNPLKFKKLKFK